MYSSNRKSPLEVIRIVFPATQEKRPVPVASGINRARILPSSSQCSVSFCAIPLRFSTRL